MTIPVLNGLAPLAAQYDGFIVDLWGVIHDGVAPYPGARDALGRLRRADKRVVLLSNAPRRAWALVEGLNRMGLDGSLYDGALSSGESVHRALALRRDPWYRRLGSRCVHLGPERDRHMMDGLDLEEVPLEQATFIFNTGPWLDEEQVSDYEDLLQAGAARRLPMVCANPDLEVIRGHVRIICAGALAARYEELGGEVGYRGKPWPEVYQDCFQLLGIAARSRILAIGDSLRTDIAGAGNAGIDSVLVTGGIHAEALGVREGELPDPVKVTALCAEYGLTPKAALPAMVW